MDPPSPDLGMMLVESPRGGSQRRLHQKGAAWRGGQSWTRHWASLALISAEFLNDFLGLCFPI